MVELGVCLKTLTPGSRDVRQSPLRNEQVASAKFAKHPIRENMHGERNLRLSLKASPKSAARTMGTMAFEKKIELTISGLNLRMCAL